MAPDRAGRESANPPPRTSAQRQRGAPLDRVRSHLRKADPVPARLIDARPTFDPQGWMAELPAMDLFGALLFQVVGQQLSVAATRRTLGHIEVLFGGRLPSPAELLEVSPESLRQAGLSWRKVATLRDLAEHLSDGRLDPDVLSKLPDGEVIAALTAIPGIGPWTARGALILALRREDVVLPGDLCTSKGHPACLQDRPPPKPRRGPGHRREVAALPQCCHEQSVLDRLRRARLALGLTLPPEIGSTGMATWPCLTGASYAQNLHLCKSTQCDRRFLTDRSEP